VAFEHNEHYQSCLVCDIVREERSAAERIVAESPGFVAYVPFAARVPYEVHVVATGHRTSLLELSHDERGGLAAILRGLGPFGIFQGTRPLPLPLPDEPIVLGPLFIPPIQLLGGIVSLLFLGGFGYFFLKSRKGVAMRAVADNQQVAMAMGIDVERYFGLAWAMTGVVSALGGMLWGNMLGVDVNLALVGFKVFPVVILGGLDSIPGAIIGGLIVGIVENVAAGYIDPFVGGGTKDFAPYVLMIVALMIRPYGIFGKRIIERI